MRSSSELAPTKTLIAIHGLLGLASDWDVIKDVTENGWHLHPIDLGDESRIVNYKEWAARTSA